MSLAHYAKKRYKQPAQQLLQKSVQVEQANDDFGIVVKDPRPDLADDSALWFSLLVKTAASDYQFYTILYAMRTVGTVIVDVNNRLKLQPIIGAGGWQSEEDYWEVVNECLRPRAEQLIALLDHADRLKSTL